jgi:hypothetical protein
LRRLKVLILGLCAAATLHFAPAAAQAGGPAAVESPAITAADGGSYLREADYRVARIVYRLGLAGRAHCPEPFPLTGLSLQHLADYRPQDHAQVIRLYGLDRGPGILSIMPDSPAAHAGIVAGDVLISVNETRFPSPREVAARAAPRRGHLVATEALLEDQLRQGPVRLEILRRGRPHSVTLGSVPGCPARGRLAVSNQANAFADGRYAIMTTRFLGFFRSDDELAVALAHELAHNILRHPQQLEAQGVPQGLLRHIGRNARLVRATELDADRLAVRLLWSAGYDLGAIIPFWRRLNARPDSMLQVISAHPGLRTRERVINEVLTELAGQPRPS